MFEQTNSDHYVNPDTIILGIKWTRKSRPMHFIWNKWRTIFKKKLLILQDMLIIKKQFQNLQGLLRSWRSVIWNTFP